jgi:3-dehydroquinate dehydratase II
MLFAWLQMPIIKPNLKVLTEPFLATKSKALPIYVLNGPNLNLLGQREPEIYGRTTLADIGKLAAKRAKERGLSIVFRQSNHEGRLIDWVHEASKKSAGLIINGGAYTHTSVALHDALRALDRPIIEVHLSNPYAREEFRRHSLISPLAKGVIVGFGANGYMLAVDAMAAFLERVDS